MFGGSDDHFALAQSFCVLHACLVAQLGNFTHVSGVFFWFLFRFVSFNLVWFGLVWFGLVWFVWFGWLQTDIHLSFTDKGDPHPSIRTQ